MLQRRGGPPATIDDALQTAALRALQRDRRFDTADGWVNWTIEVAWHEVQIEWRRQARVVPGEVPELPDGHDPSRVVLGRHDLDATKSALSALSDAERTAILSPLADDPLVHEHEPAAVKMRRYRARRRLAALLNAEIGTSDRLGT